MELIKLSDILIDERFQARESLNESNIEELRKLYLDSVSLPPVDVCRIDGGDSPNGLYLISGFHRFEAQKRNNAEVIECNIEDCSFDEAILKASASNSGHGQKLTAREKITAIKAVLNTETYKEISDKELCEKLKVSRYLVRQAKDELFREWAKDMPRKRNKHELIEEPAFSGKRDRFDVPMPISLIGVDGVDSALHIIRGNVEELFSQFQDNLKHTSMALVPVAGVSMAFRNILKMLADARFYCVCTECYGFKSISGRKCKRCVSFGEPTGFLTKEMYLAWKGESDE